MPLVHPPKGCVQITKKLIDKIIFIIKKGLVINQTLIIAVLNNVLNHNVK
jgi:hypothetical protein